MENQLNYHPIEYLVAPLAENDNTPHHPRAYRLTPYWMRLWDGCNADFI